MTLVDVWLRLYVSEFFSFLWFALKLVPCIMNLNPSPTSRTSTSAQGETVGRC